MKGDMAFFDTNVLIYAFAKDDRRTKIAETLLDYAAIGVTTLLIRGYDPEADAADYAKIIKLVREQDPTLAGVGG